MAQSTGSSLGASLSAKAVASSGNQTPCQTPKRKRGTDENHGSAFISPAKRKKVKSVKRDEDENLDIVKGLNLSMGQLDSRLQADYVAQRTKSLSPDLSLVELEDRHIPEIAFQDTSDWESTRVLPNLPDFLSRYSLRAGGNEILSSSSKNPGSPHTLVITAAALRAADVTRALRVFQTKEGAVAKLFAKHIKLKDALEYVKNTRISIGVGTPSRINDLFDSGALIASKLQRVVIDASYIDQKKRGIFGMRETHEPLLQLLNRPELKNRYGSDTGSIRILLY